MLNHFLHPRTAAYSRWSCFMLVGWHLARGIDSERHNMRHQSAPLTSLYGRFLPLLLAQLTSVPFAFLYFLTPTCSHSLAPPAPAFISHLPLNRLQWVSVGTGRKGRLGGRPLCRSDGMVLNNYHAYFCVPDEPNSTSACFLSDWMCFGKSYILNNI